LDTVPVSHDVRRASVCITLFFVLGTYYGLSTDIVPLHILMVAGLSWIFALLAVFYSSIKAGSVGASWVTTVCIFFCIYCTAFLSASLSSLNQKRCSGYACSLYDGHRIEMTGIIDADADVLPSMKPHQTVIQSYLLIEKSESEGDLLVLDNQRIRIILYGRDKLNIPLYGERWKISGRIFVDKRKGSFSDGRNVCVKASAFDARFISDSNGWWLARRCYAARRAASALLTVGISDYPNTTDILQSLVLGYRRLSYEMRQLFVFTGTLHIFAISGSHVVVFGGIIVVVLGMFRISSIYWGFFLGPLLCAYTFASGMQSSAVRACIMALIYWSAPIVRRRADALTALCISALLILSIAPTQLQETGFILSFVCVLGLIVLFPLINSPVQALLIPDPLRLQAESKTITFGRSVAGIIWSTVSMSLAAWLASVPLIAYYFGNFTPIGMLSNLIVIPLSFFVLLTGCLSLVLGACVTSLAVVFNHANLFLIGIMMWAMDLMARIPYGSVKVESVPMWGITLWYFLLGLFVFARRK